MFKCPKCGNSYEIPTCQCGYTVCQNKKIWQLSDAPDIVLDGEGDKYIGYEHIGENYTGSKKKYKIEEKDYKIAEKVAELTGEGIFLDLACGNGYLAVPVASFNTKVIAGDISNTMLSILMEKAEINDISLNNVTACRMNALDIPIEDNSISCVTANSVLHLISNPTKVIEEIKRVLKADGVFICLADAPAREKCPEYDNSLCNEIVHEFYNTYWKKLIKRDIHPTKYSWKFDRNDVCCRLFKNVEKDIIKYDREYSRTIKEGFLTRIWNRGFSDQVAVPRDIHDEVILEVYEEIASKYGSQFSDVKFRGRENDIVLTKYSNAK